MSSYGLYVCFRTSNIQNILYKSNSYSFDYQKNSYFILEYVAGVQEGNIRKTMAARGLVKRGPRSGRDLVFRCYPSELLLPSPKKTEADLWGQPRSFLSSIRIAEYLFQYGLADRAYIFSIIALESKCECCQVNFLKRIFCPICRVRNTCVILTVTIL